MGIYIISYLFAFSLSIISITTKSKEKKNERNLFLLFILISLIIGLRHPTMGNDLKYYEGYGYIHSFVVMKGLSIRNSIRIFSSTYEVGYILLNKLVGSLGFGWQGLLIVCSFISIMPIWYVIKDKKAYPLLQYCIFWGLPAFMMYFSALRQGIAMGIAFLSFKFIETKKIVPFVITVLIAALFHVSAIILLFAYPIYYLKIEGKNRIFTPIIILIAYLTKKIVFSILSSLLSLIGYSMYLDINSTGALGILLELSAIYFFGCIYYKESEIRNGYMNILLFACLCQVFASINWMAMRVTYYFMYTLMILLPDIFSDIASNYDKRIIYMIILLSFWGMGIIFLLQTRSNWAMSVPYHFYWEKI